MVNVIVKDKKINLVVMFGIIIVVLIGVIVYNSFKESNAEIKIQEVVFHPTFGLSFSKGCLTDVNGTVLNIGKITADDIVVTCNVIGSGETDITGKKSLGFLRENEERYFEMTINNKCPAPYDVECSATCKNCMFTVYG